jgi:response regulator RpfG family c-di-GMP phosphodiesterase
MSGPSKHPILVVDDELSIRESLTLLLVSSGYDVLTANDGFAALLHLRQVLTAWPAAATNEIAYLRQGEICRETRLTRLLQNMTARLAKARDNMLAGTEEAGTHPRPEHDVARRL